MIGAVFTFTISFAILYICIKLNKLHEFNAELSDAMFLSFVIALLWFISIPVLAITGAVKWSIDKCLEQKSNKEKNNNG